MSWSRPLCLLLIALVSTSALAEASPIRCNLQGSQLELNACAQDALENADKALNNTYQTLLKRAASNPAFVRNLRTAQRAWLAFRDADMQARFTLSTNCTTADPRMCWGSMYPLLYLGTKARLTQERTRHLEEMLEEARW